MSRELRGDFAGRRVHVEWGGASYDVSGRYYRHAREAVLRALDAALEGQGCQHVHVVVHDVGPSCDHEHSDAAPPSGDAPVT